MTLWLDDIRDPAHHGHIGAKWVKTVQEAKDELLTGTYTHASLDHDLGCCDVCQEGMTASEWLFKYNYKSMPNCQHFGTGYDLVCWMEETGNWPPNKVKVHSANPTGTARMRQVINKFYDRIE